jgi:hypothetical protein
MLASEASTTTAKPTTLATPKKTAAGVAKVSDPAGLENKIRGRAHQLYEGRGCEPGKDKQDWLRAEQEILKLEP